MAHDHPFIFSQPQPPYNALTQVQTYWGEPGG